MDQSSATRSKVEELFDTLSAQPSPVRCNKCGSSLLSLDATFFWPGGKVWTVPLPVCSKCDLKNDTAKFVSVPPSICRP